MQDIPEMEAADDAEGAPEPVVVEIPPELAGARLDKALAELAPPGLSRSRLRALIEAGAVAGPDGAVVTDPRRKVKTGEAWRAAPPPPVAPEPAAEPISLDVMHEDADLIVVNKPAGMVVHPAPGQARGTLVNALLHHCDGRLAGVGGVARPGIVHRIDKDTSGLLVAAKSDAAHQGLSALFAAHDVERAYLALAHGAPGAESARIMGLPGVTSEPDGALRIETEIGRHRVDRQRMAVGPGRRAVTRARAVARAAGGAASRVECRLETGRTHQIRVHLAWLGCPLIGDPVYGRGRRAGAALPDAARAAADAFPRQALHAATLGFLHPVTGARLRFEAPPPADFAALAAALGLGPPAP